MPSAAVLDPFEFRPFPRLHCQALTLIVRHTVRNRRGQRERNKSLTVELQKLELSRQAAPWTPKERAMRTASGILRPFRIQSISRPSP